MFTHGPMCLKKKFAALIRQQESSPLSVWDSQSKLIHERLAEIFNISSVSKGLDEIIEGL
jgi:hypothetical protein